MDKNRQTWERMGLELVLLDELIGKALCDPEYQSLMDKRTWDSKLKRMSDIVMKLRSDCENRMAKKNDDWSADTFYPKSRKALREKIDEIRKWIYEESSYKLLTGKEQCAHCQKYLAFPGCLGCVADDGVSCGGFIPIPGGKTAKEVSEQVYKLVEADTYELTCVNCAFNPDNGADMCFAPWTDGTMEDDDIDPCYEGVFRYITGKSERHLDKLLCSGRMGVWIRDKGKEMRCVDEG